MSEGLRVQIGLVLLGSSLETSFSLIFFVFFSFSSSSSSTPSILAFLPSSFSSSSSSTSCNALLRWKRRIMRGDFMFGWVSPTCWCQSSCSAELDPKLPSSGWQKASCDYQDRGPCRQPSETRRTPSKLLRREKGDPCLQSRGGRQIWRWESAIVDIHDGVS